MWAAAATTLAAAWRCPPISGIGQPEYALHRISDWLASQGLEPKVAFLRAGDILAEARNALQEMSPPSTCVFGDLTNRMPARTKNIVDAILTRHRDEQQKNMQAAQTKKKKRAAKQASERAYLNEVKELFKGEPTASTKAVQSWCQKHKRMCPVNAHPELAGNNMQLLLSIAGINCFDWSPRGAKRGLLGRSCMAFTAYMREVMHTLPSVVVLECVRTYQEEDAKFMLQDHYFSKNKQYFDIGVTIYFFRFQC